MCLVFYSPDFTLNQMEIFKYKTRGLMLSNKKFLGFLYKSNDLTASKVLANGTDLQIRILIQERALNFAFFLKKKDIFTISNFQKWSPIQHLF